MLLWLWRDDQRSGLSVTIESLNELRKTVEAANGAWFDPAYAGERWNED